MRTHGVSFHQYADDTQIYYTFSQGPRSYFESGGGGGGGGGLTSDSKWGGGGLKTLFPQ